jgi:ketosteroid isomerase-like protein
VAGVSAKEKVGEAVSQAKRRVGVEAPDAADAGGRVGIVRGALRAFGSGDVDAFVDALRSDVDWEAPGGDRFPGGAHLSGRDAVRERFVEDVKRTYASFGFRPDSFLDVDAENAVVAIGRFAGESAEGKQLDAPAAQLWELKGSSVARVCIFTDSAQFPPLASGD